MFWRLRALGLRSPGRGLAVTRFRIWAGSPRPQGKGMRWKGFRGKGTRDPRGTSLSRPSKSHFRPTLSSVRSLEASRSQDKAHRNA